MSKISDLNPKDFSVKALKHWGGGNAIHYC